LSFTHLAEIIQLPDESQRRLYEFECIRGNWSVRELRRQITSLYYERLGLSKEQSKLSARTGVDSVQVNVDRIVRDPYVFEFLGLRSQDTMGESDLEDALLDRLLIELKVDAFRHEHLGQLNSYVAYFKKHEMTEGDQPPIGILLCTHKNDALVEFALGDISNKLFVSRYALEIPDKAAIVSFLRGIAKEFGYE
jgi:predicted nuclease of restriction endonuclease-like (RecB) superfamily